MLLADIADIEMGISPPGDSVNKSSVGHPLLNGPTEFGGHHPTPVQFSNSGKKFAEEGDLLFCVRGSTTGRMNWSDQVYAIGRGIAAITHKSDKTLNPFIRGVIEHALPTLLKGATGSTFPNVSKSDLESLHVSITDINEQRRIAHILGTLDDKIELNRQMNQTLDEITRTLFRSWFVDFDPVRAKMEGRQPDGMDAATAALFPDRLVDSELGPIPEGWSWETLADVADNVRDNVKADELEPDEIYVGLEHFERRHLALYQWGNASELASNKSRFVEGDILFGKLRPYFHKVAIAPIDGVCSTEIFVIRPKRPGDHSWVSVIASSDSMIEHATQRSSGTRMPRANWNDVGGFTIAIPSIEVRDSFEGVTRPMFELVMSNVMESRSLADLRDTLLPELLGEN